MLPAAPTRAPAPPAEQACCGEGQAHARRGGSERAPRCRCASGQGAATTAAVRGCIIATLTAVVTEFDAGGRAIQAVALKALALDLVVELSLPFLDETRVVTRAAICALV